MPYKRHFLVLLEFCNLAETLVLKKPSDSAHESVLDVPASVGENPVFYSTYPRIVESAH